MRAGPDWSDFGKEGMLDRNWNYTVVGVVGGINLFWEIQRKIQKALFGSGVGSIG